MKNFQLYRGQGPNKTHVIEDYKELVWTERFLDMNDFLLVCPATVENRSRFAIGSWLSHNQSTSVMRVFTVEEVSENGERYMRVSGYGLESILKDRSVRPTAGKEFRQYNSTRSSSVAANIIRENLVDGTMFHEYDTMLNVNVYNTVGIFDDTSATWAIPIQSAWDAVHSTLALDNLGLLVSASPINSNLSFTVSSGTDRSETVIFTALADHFLDDTFYNSDDDYKTVAYAFGRTTARYIYRTGTDNITQGFFRRVLTINVVDLEDADMTTNERNLAISNRARVELAKHARRRMIDGRLSIESPYQFRSDYYVGDIVTVVSSNGNKDKARITEYIWSVNSEGVEAYPTFTSTSMES